MRTLLPLLVLSCSPAWAEDDDDDRMIEFDALPALGYVGSPSMSATPGGAQDIGYFRDRVMAGEIPHANVLTPEGLFGEHDLPITGTKRCVALLCPVVAAIPARLIAQPEVRWLAQLGFDSGLDAASFQRAPLNLVAVVDKSGSMSGEPLETVKASLDAVATHMGPGDQLSIVLYGDVVETRLPPTPATRVSEIRRAIAGISSAGSTDMESGLRQGYTLARQTAPRFDGTTRVMLFTDERPNVGATDAQSFMGMARAASVDHVGLTTVGVGVQFGAELASAVSAVRGGNLYYFANATEMKTRFAAEFDTLVTELAYDFELTVRPAKGLEVTGVYGIPGDMVSRTPDGAIQMTVETLFLSRQEGAIYLTFGDSADIPANIGGALASVSVRYTPAFGEGGGLQVLDVRPTHPEAGLIRGMKLVDEYTVLKAATALHHEKNDQEGAWQLVHALAGSQAGDTDPDLANERALIARLDQTLALLSGHRGEIARARVRDPVSGLPR